MGKQQQQQPHEECQWWWRSRRRTCGHRTLRRNLFWRQEVSGCSLLVVWVEIGCVGLGWVGLAKGSAGTKFCTQLSNRCVLERLVFSTPTCHLSTITGGIPHSNPDGLTYLIWGICMADCVLLCLLENYTPLPELILSW